jgi:2-methylcitrate dehydratase PrpD
VQAQFSIPYTVACALLRGDVGLADFTDAALTDPEVRELAAKVDTRIDESIEREWSRNISPTHLVAMTHRGSFEARVDVPRGHVQAPMSREDFDRKMAGCLEVSGIHWPADTVVRLRATIDGLEEAPRGADVISAVMLERERDAA